MAAERQSGKQRVIGGFVLLSILAACAYAGTIDHGRDTVSVSMTRSSLVWEEYEQDSVETAAERIKTEREAEIDMLTAVAENEQAGSQTRADALDQIAQIARRMEYEASSRAVLSEMGFDQFAVVCGAEMMSVIIRYDDIANEADRIRMVDALCSVTGFDAGDIKIILAKK